MAHSSLDFKSTTNTVKIYSQFSLFAVVTFYKVTTHTELASTKPLFLGLDTCKPLVTTF